MNRLGQSLANLSSAARGDDKQLGDELTPSQKAIHESLTGAKEYLLSAWFYRAMEEIRDARIRNKLTQKEVAERLGTTQSAVARLESAHRGTFSLERFLEYAWASGLGPLDAAFVPAEELRWFAFEDPLAARTVTSVRDLRPNSYSPGVNINFSYSNTPYDVAWHHCAPRAQSDAPMPITETAVVANSRGESPNPTAALEAAGRRSGVASVPRQKVAA